MDLIVNCANGVYGPQIFVERLKLSEDQPMGCEEGDINIVKKGPNDNEDYWDAWTNITDNFVSPEGREIYELEGDIWLCEPGEIDQQVDSDISYLKSLT